MKHKKLVIAVVVMLGALLLLVRAAANETAKSVVTVAQLVSSGEARTRVRLGGRVTNAEVHYQTQPALKLEFEVQDPPAGAEHLSVVYAGVMPDTFQSGRDVILEGDFDGQVFHAQNLMTQCPSKYEPKVPGVSK